MNKDIRIRDKQGKLHGKQIDYFSNGNINFIENYNHGLRHGYLVYFNTDKSIEYKLYFNMGNRIYKESHWTKQIKIKI